MGFITPNDYDTLRSLYKGQLQYLLSAENQIVAGLESMILHAEDKQLKQAFQSHQQETRVHAERLESILKRLVGSDDDKKDPVLAVLISSAANIVRESSAGAVRDAGLIASAQKIEHYEMASYGSARDWAKNLGLSEDAELLQKTLDEEEHVDHLLTTIAQRENPTAATEK